MKKCDLNHNSTPSLLKNSSGGVFYCLPDFAPCYLKRPPLRDVPHQMAGALIWILGYPITTLGCVNRAPGGDEYPSLAAGSCYGN